MAPLVLALLVLAAGADTTPDCLAHYHGLVAAPDLPAARRCLEQASSAPCDGKPVDLARAQLAVMYLDGQGGSAEPARAAALLAGCAEDRTLFELRRTFGGRAPTGTFALCRELAGAPALRGECSGIEAALAAQERTGAARRLRAGLPEEAQGPFDAAELAWSRFLAAELDRVVARVRTPGSESLVRAATLAAREGARTAWLRSLSAAGELACPAQERARDDGRLERALADAGDGLGAQPRAALQAAQAAWAAFRDAEASWVDRWRGAGARAAATCALARQRARMLEAHEPEDVTGAD